MARRLAIAVIGGGNGAYATCADLVERGHEIRLWRRDGQALAPVAERRGLTVRDHTGEREVSLASVGTNLAEILDGAEVVIVPLPATAQRDVALALAPHLRDGQVVFAPPGTFGSYLMARAIRDAGCDSQVAFAESGTLPYLARKQGEATVAITARATRLPTGVFPARDSGRVFELLAAAFPSIERCADSLDAALTNAGPIIHPPLIVLNAGPIEHFEKWDIHSEGTQPAIRRVQDALDAERVALREALGYPPPHFPLRDHYSPDGEEWMYGNAAHERLVDSSHWREPLDLLTHRYMREDVECGLSLMVSIGEWLGHELPVARGLLAVAGAIASADFRRTGRTLGRLGLAGYDPPVLRRLLVDGL